MPRIRISKQRHEAITIDRISHGKLKLAYVLCADKKIKYTAGRSRIVYIGTTENGMNRIAQSVAYRSDDIFNLHGVFRFTAHIVTCTPRQKIKSWRKLERALILQFKDLYGEKPACNTHGKGYKWRDEDELFSVSRLTTILNDLS